MNAIKAVLFDADGVIITPPQLFSDYYAQKYGYRPESFEHFFRGDFSDAIIGKTDLKELIRKRHDVWRWEKDPQELLDMWFEAEHVTDPAVMKVIRLLKAASVPTYLATNQEKYRAQYFRDTVFPDDMFDDMFISSELGFMKRDSGFWPPVLECLAQDVPGIQPAEIILFDDSQDCIDGARAAGLTAQLYTHVEQITALVDQLL